MKKTLTAHELKQMREKKPEIAVLNVLEPETFAREHIPGSINVPVKHESFATKAEKQVGGKNRPVVVYCASQECDSSPTAAKKLVEAGFTEVYDFEGGMKSWKDAKLPVEGQKDTADTKPSSRG